MAVRFLNKSTIAQGLPRSSKVWDQLAVMTIPIEYLVVAGGGGGGIGVSGQYHGGGGGAGGLLSGTFTMQPSTAYTITVGSGGVANSSSGVGSRFNTVLTVGGGAGGIWGGAGYSGGSGGGGSRSDSAGSGTAGPPRQGYDGAVGAQLVGGGGGGATGAGYNYFQNSSLGGPGLTSTITGASTVYAAGGAGGLYASTAGAANSGTGGNGGLPGNNGGNGGSGVVIIAYPNIYPNIPNIDAGLTYTLDASTRAGYKVYRFTNGTGTVSV